MNTKRAFLLITVVVSSMTSLFSQSKSPQYEAYIKKYANLAVESQQKHKIPASITLAQGLLESAAGESRLAKQCNNHFGIKCGNSWHGRTMRQNDDALRECFRCYNNVVDSYNDHAEFLKRERYAFLFDYKITDYKSWANGLKKAGYATDPKYPQKLIKIIEDYELYKYDSGENATTKEKKNVIGELFLGTNKTKDKNDLFGYTEIKINGVKCYQLANEDSFKNISKHTGISVVELLYFNDLPKSRDLYRGDIVYLQPKKNKASKGAKKYTVKAGDSMHSISQEFGIKLKALYKINKLTYGTPAEVGQTLKLR